MAAYCVSYDLNRAGYASSGRKREEPIWDGRELSSRFRRVVESVFGAWSLRHQIQLRGDDARGRSAGAEYIPESKRTCRVSRRGT